MKVTTLINSILLTIAIAGTALTSTARAAHAATYLDALEADVNARLEAVDENTTGAENRALNSASRILARESRTLNADLGLLAQAAIALDNAFSGDAQFAAEEESALDGYAGEAQSQLDALNLLLGTNAPPRSVANQLAQAQAALERGNDSSNSVPVRARALALALNKIRVATIQTTRTYKAPVTLEETITLVGRGRGAATVTLDANHAYIIPGDEGDETGTWSYERTGTKTATITLFPIGGDPRTIDLKFSNSGRGTFNGTTATGEPFRGQFTVEAE